MIYEVGIFLSVFVLIMYVLRYWSFVSLQTGRREQIRSRVSERGKPTKSGSCIVLWEHRAVHC